MSKEQDERTSLYFCLEFERSEQDNPSATKNLRPSRRLQTTCRRRRHEVRSRRQEVTTVTGSGRDGQNQSEPALAKETCRRSESCRRPGGEAVCAFKVVFSKNAPLAFCVSIKFPRVWYLDFTRNKRVFGRYPSTTDRRAPRYDDIPESYSLFTVFQKASSPAGFVYARRLRCMRVSFGFFIFKSPLFHTETHTYTSSHVRLQVHACFSVVFAAPFISSSFLNSSGCSTQKHLAHVQLCFLFVVRARPASLAHSSTYVAAPYGKGRRFQG